MDPKNEPKMETQIPEKNNEDVQIETWICSLVPFLTHTMKQKIQTFKLFFVLKMQSPKFEGVAIGSVNLQSHQVG